MIYKGIIEAYENKINILQLYRYRDRNRNFNNRKEFMYLVFGAMIVLKHK